MASGGNNFNDFPEIVPTREITTDIEKTFLVRGRGPVSTELDRLFQILTIFWNSLSNSVIDASTINAFKAWLDKFWLHQAVKYDLQPT